MSKAQFQKDFYSLVEREFSVKETLSQLQHNMRLFMCWGVSRLINHANKGLLLSVNGMNLKGFVFITLAWDDTYTVRFYNTKYNEVKPKLTNVYCDELTQRIDEVIEKIPEYRY